MQSAGVAGGPRDAARMIDPIHQFNIEKIFTIGRIGNQEIAFTNSSAYMFGSVALISLLMIGGVAGRQLVPGRIQSMAELSYEFVANTIQSTAGKEGMKFFPLVFSIFMLLTVSNMVGVIPYSFTISSHLIVTAALALLVFFPVLAGLGIAGYAGAVLPLGMVIALTALELLVAFLQAYVFTILTCIYLNDAIHPGH